MIFNTGTGVVEPKHFKSRIQSKIRVTTEIIESLSASKNPCFQQCYFVEILWLKNLCQFTQSCFLNSFQLVFYTSLTLRRCNTLCSINNSPTTKSTLPNVLLILFSTLYSMLAQLSIVHNTLLQLYFKRCDIEPYPVTFILRILLLQHSQVDSSLQNKKLTRLRITVQNN